MKSIDLSYCGRVAIEECARVKPGERVLVVTDTLRDQSITRALLVRPKASGLRRCRSCSQPVLVNLRRRSWLLPPVPMWSSCTPLFP